MKEIWTTILKYFKDLSRIWITWLFLILDGLGVFLLVVSYFRPSFNLPFWTFWIFIAVTLIGFIAANIKMFSDLISEKNTLVEKINLLQKNEIDEKSLYIGQYFPNSSPYTAIELRYINGKYPIEVERVSCIYNNNSGEKTEVQIKNFFPLSDLSLSGQFINLNILYLKEGVRFHPPQKIQGNEILVIAKVIDTKLKESVTIKKTLVLNASANPQPVIHGGSNPFYD